jgi:hypothetical protein
VFRINLSLRCDILCHLIIILEISLALKLWSASESSLGLLKTHSFGFHSWISCNFAFLNNFLNDIDIAGPGTTLPDNCCSLEYPLKNNRNCGYHRYIETLQTVFFYSSSPFFLIFFFLLPLLLSPPLFSSFLTSSHQTSTEHFPAVQPTADLGTGELGSIHVCPME